MKMKGTCELCGRTEIDLTVHHLVPKEEGGVHLPTADLCIACHKQIHALFTNQELAVNLNTAARLRAEPRMAAFVKWVRKQPSSTQIQIRKSNRVKFKTTR
ncbi:HNH endonuclease [Marinicrinis sediminis]|uniref:HNH endonuclease n=1 Tax=Marinicrinis sediminis TaxID=1652465 RepID=A0ABW5REQ4_9BACL